MPIDTADKRGSAMNVGLSFGRVLPFPDAAALDQGDRQEVAFLYRGILAHEGPAALQRRHTDQPDRVGSRSNWIRMGGF